MAWRSEKTRSTKDEVLLMKRYIADGYSDGYIAILFNRERTVVCHWRKKFFNGSTAMLYRKPRKIKDFTILSERLDEIRKTKRIKYTREEYENLVVKRLLLNTPTQPISEKTNKLKIAPEKIEIIPEQPDTCEQVIKKLPIIKVKNYKDYLAIAKEKAHPKFRSMYTNKRHTFSEVTVLA